MYLSVFTVSVLVAGVSEQIRPSCCPSFFVCLSYGCIFSCFYQTPSLLSCPVLMSLSLYQCLSVCVCVSVFLCGFPSPSFPSLPPFLLLSFFLSLSLTLAVSTFGENSTGAPLGKVPPLSSSSSTLPLALHHGVKSASHSFFLCSSDRSYSFSLCRTLSYSSHATEKPPERRNRFVSPFNLRGLIWSSQVFLEGACFHIWNLIFPSHIIDNRGLAVSSFTQVVSFNSYHSKITKVTLPTVRPYALIPILMHDALNKNWLSGVLSLILIQNIYCTYLICESQRAFALIIMLMCVRVCAFVRMGMFLIPNTYGLSGL